MRTAWRIVSQQGEHAAFDGEGARLYGGRWNSPGNAAVYTAESRALATLELLVHLSGIVPARMYSFIPVRFPENLIVQVEDAAVLEAALRPVAGPLSQRHGDHWIQAAESVVLQVPSAIIRSEWNYVLNPNHPGFRKIEIGDSEPFSLDPRLLR